MPRVYVPNPKGKKHKSVQHEKVKAAVKAVVNGSSVRKAAAKFGVSKSAIQRYKTEVQDKMVRAGKSPDEIDDFIDTVKFKKKGGQTWLPYALELQLITAIIM